MNGTGYQYNTQINATRCFRKGTEPVARWHCTQSLQRQKRHTNSRRFARPILKPTVPKFWAVCQRSQRSHASQNSRESILSMPWKPFLLCFVLSSHYCTSKTWRPGLKSIPLVNLLNNWMHYFLAQKPETETVRLNCFNSCPKTSCPPTSPITKM